MNIAIIGTRGIPARYGGFETAAEEISSGLVKRGHKVTVYCRYRNSDRKIKEYKGVKLVYIPHLDSKNIGTLSHSLLSFINVIFQSYDIILVFNVGLAPLCCIPKLFHKMVVLNVDGLEWQRRKWGWLASRYFLFCERIASLFSDSIITDSLAIKDYYKDKYHIDSVYIPYGAYTDTSCNFKILDLYGVKKNDYFFIASRLEPENNADLIARTFQKINTGKKLLIAGGANYRSSFVENLLKIKDERIKFLGPIYDQEHIKALHCGCFAYIHGNEVGGTNPSLLKAMGFGNCILALDVPFNREVVAETAILFNKSGNDLKELIKFLLDNPKKLNFFRKKSLERVAKYYNWNNVISRYEGLFTNLLTV